MTIHKISFNMLDNGKAFFYNKLQYLKDLSKADEL